MESSFVRRLEFSCILFCLIGCGIHCWKLGKMEGIEGTVQYFIDQGYIEVEEPDVE